MRPLNAASCIIGFVSVAFFISEAYKKVPRMGIYFNCSVASLFVSVNYEVGNFV